MDSVVGDSIVDLVDGAVSVAAAILAGIPAGTLAGILAGIPVVDSVGLVDLAASVGVGKHL